eukprot:739-Heterococcus_DN1.PRE.5
MRCRSAPLSKKRYGRQTQAVCTNGGCSRLELCIIRSSLWVQLCPQEVAACIDLSPNILFKPSMLPCEHTACVPLSTQSYLH